jgi:hypothetical protein
MEEYFSSNSGSIINSGESWGSCMYSNGEVTIFLSEELHGNGALVASHIRCLERIWIKVFGLIVSIIHNSTIVCHISLRCNIATKARIVQCENLNLCGCKYLFSQMVTIGHPRPLVCFNAPHPQNFLVSPRLLNCILLEYLSQLHQVREILAIRTSQRWFT